MLKTIIIQKNDAGQRLDKFLQKSVKSLPLSLMYKYIRTKKIKLNHMRAHENQILQINDVIELYIKDEFFDSAEKDKNALASIVPKLEILYEDQNIMVVNKRPGVLVHEDESGKDNTLIMHIWAYLFQKGEYDPKQEQSFVPALCNRIDRNTGGIVLAAKNAESLRILNEKIKNNEISKKYICLVHGIMPQKEDILHAYLKKNTNDNTVSVIDSPRNDYKEIWTGYRVLKTNNKDSLLEVDLITGRTHQIRAQMAHIGHPLFGDGKYGINRDDKSKGYKYQALYAFQLKFAFEKQSGNLDYLKGKIVSIPKEQIWFYNQI